MEWLGCEGVTERVGFVIAVEKKHIKPWKEEDVLPATVHLPAPWFFTLLCNFMEYDSQLGNFNEDKKKKDKETVF